MELTFEHAKKVLELVDQGLTTGLGNPKPGEMCVEAAVCFAFGLPHGDNPPCIGPAVRAFKIRLNDSFWSSNQIRAAGMRRLAIAQLGSDQIDQKKFAQLLAKQIIRKVIPIALRSAAVLNQVRKNRDMLEKAAIRCEQQKGIHTAIREAYMAARTAHAVNIIYAVFDAANAINDAHAAADTDVIIRAAYMAARAVDETARAADGNRRDEILFLGAAIAADILLKLGSRGTQWLYLAK